MSGIFGSIFNSERDNVFVRCTDLFVFVILRCSDMLRRGVFGLYNILTF